VRAPRLQLGPGYRVGIRSLRSGGRYQTRRQRVAYLRRRMGLANDASDEGRRRRLCILSLAGGPRDARLRQEPSTGAKNSRGRRLCTDPTLGLLLRSFSRLPGSGCGDCGRAAVAFRFCVCRLGGTTIREDPGVSEVPLAEGLNHSSQNDLGHNVIGGFTFVESFVFPSVDVSVSTFVSVADANRRRLLPPPPEFLAGGKLSANWRVDC
jgi:hypothetical protein